jgi:hypothetical protein
MVVINQVKHHPRIKNSTLLLFAAAENIDLGKIDKVLSSFNYDLAVKLFVFAVQKEGGNLTEQEVHDEVDRRIECFTELMMYVASQLNPEGVGEAKPGNPGKKKTAA